MKRLTLSCLLIAGLLFGGSLALMSRAASPSPDEVQIIEVEGKTALTEATVVRVIDGDTIKVDIDGYLYTVRYIGIDTPETVHPQKPVEYFGKEAAEKNRELVWRKTVRLEKDVSETDRYGRLLRYVWVGDVMVNAELARLGYAQVSTYPPDVKYQGLFLQLQREAIETGKGMWISDVIPLPDITLDVQHPPGATALCNDGTYSYSQHRSGTCSHHGGVKQWINRPPT